MTKLKMVKCKIETEVAKNEGKTDEMDFMKELQNKLNCEEFGRKNLRKRNRNRNEGIKEQPSTEINKAGL